MEYQERKRWLFFGLPFTFTIYRATENELNIKKGLLRTIEDDTFMYKINDVKLSKTLLEKIFGLGTVICYSGDVTDPKLELKHIKNSDKIKEFIRLTSEKERRKVRTLHTMDLDGDFSSVDINDVE